MDSYALGQLEANVQSEWCKYRLHVWSKRRTFIFAAETDESFKPWVSAAKDFLSSRYTNDEIADKNDAFKVSDFF